jgi:hypothetical protein
MANPSTTHVIEIETGIGEPAFIPLTLGQELQPISVGKKGMWRIESPRVMDVHAFVYFDGSSLFLQSADESAAATVDGYKIGKAWTELHAPCKIEIGTARLRYRSLMPDNDSALTVIKGAPPVQGQPGAAAQTRPPVPRAGSSGQQPAVPAPPQPAQPPQPQASAPPPPPGAPASFPKTERPFKPGEFISADDESTRFAPVAASNTRTGASAALAMSGANRPQAPPGESQPSLVDTTRAEAGAMRPRTGAVQALPAGNSGPYAPIGASPMQSAMQAMQGTSPPGIMGSMPPALVGSMPPMMQGSVPPGYPNPGQMSFPPGQYPGPAAGSGAFNAMGPNPQLGPSMPPGGFGSMTPQGGQPAPPQGGMQEAIAKFKEMPPLKRVLVFVLPIAMALAVFSMWDDDAPPPPKKPVTSADAGGASAGDGGAAANTVPPVTPPPPPPSSNWPEGVPCPPPGWPPDRPLPCTPKTTNPNDTAPPPPPPPPDKKDAGTVKEKDAGSKDHSPPVPAGTKTLERQAVDAVAAGDPARAAAIYEELSKRDPNNRVYAEAARILRAKLDAGTGP